MKSTTLRIGDTDVPRIGLGTNRLTHTPENVAFDVAVRRRTAIVSEQKYSSQSPRWSGCFDSASSLPSTRG